MKKQFNHFGQTFLKGDFEHIYEVTSTTFQEMISKHDFIVMCKSFNDGVTNYTLFSEKPWFGTTQSVWVDDRNERAIQLIYNGDTILGLQMKPFSLFESNSRLTMNQYRMPIDDEWFVFWGGTNEFDNYHYTYENQRYAYDLVKVKKGTTHKGTGNANSDYYAFGANVVAPLHGTVVKIVDGYKDNSPGEMDELHPAGNYVIIEHPQNEYSVLAHFQEGSIVVREGDIVEVGQLLGKCGNSGNSSEPHIHFHVMDKASMDDATSIRIRFQYLKEPVQGDTVAPLKEEKQKMDLGDKIDNSLSLLEFLLLIPRAIIQFFKN